MDVIASIIPVVPDSQFTHTLLTSEVDSIHSTIKNENKLRIYIPKRKNDAVYATDLALSSILAIPFAPIMTSTTPVFAQIYA